MVLGLMKKMKSVLLASILSFSIGLLPLATYAQGTIEGKPELTGTRKQVATIVFAGLAGAILGLSTLSFYGRPQDHLSNIAVGFALGVITGAVYTTWKAATRPYDAYDLGQTFQDEEYKRFTMQSHSAPVPRLAYSWEF